MNGYGLQMYSVRDIAEKNLRETLKTVAEIGYTSVEYAGFFGNSAENVAKWQEEFGLSCCGTHTVWTELLSENIERCINFHKIIGCKRIVVPGADLNTLEKIEQFCKVMNTANQRLKAEGIQLAYHNHNREFVLMPWGSTIHSELEKRGEFDFQLDTYWVFEAGADPIQTMERLKERLNVIHLKDGLRGGEGKSLGQGIAPVTQVLKKAREMHLDIVVESEGCEPTGADEVRRCMDYLRLTE